MSSLDAGLLQRDLAVGTKRAARRVVAARIARDQHERLGALVGDAHAQSRHDAVEDLRALARPCRFERLDDPIVESPLCHIPLRGNVGTTDMPVLEGCPMRRDGTPNGSKGKRNRAYINPNALI